MSRITHILVHTAVPIVTVGTGDRIEGEREEDVIDGTPFACVFFPTGTREAGRGGRRIDQPMMLIDGINSILDPFELHAEDVVRLTVAPGLGERDLGEYQVDGEPMPLGRPGSIPQGWQVNLKRVRP